MRWLKYDSGGGQELHFHLHTWTEWLNYSYIDYSNRA